MTPASFSRPHVVDVLYEHSISLFSVPKQATSVMAAGATTVWNSSWVKFNAPKIKLFAWLYQMYFLTCVILKMKSIYIRKVHTMQNKFKLSPG